MKLLAVITILGLGSGVFGLRCWNCQKATSNQECNADGRVQTCSVNQACVNEERTSANGSRYEITKGCSRRTSKSCRLSAPQNFGTYPTKCVTEKAGSLCECCCNTDMCNSPHTECKDEITCRRPDKPGNGRIRCPKSITYGTRCFVVCNQGFVRNGPNAITCTNGTDQGYWSPRDSVACLSRSTQPVNEKAQMCKSRMIPPDNGSIVCEMPDEHKDKETNNYVGTVCAFRCNAGYSSSGQETTECLSGGRWSNKRLNCKKGTCQQPRSDTKRIDSCSEAFDVGSVCNMQCKPGFKLEGNSSSTCNLINDQILQGQWSNEFPRCVRAVCRPQLTTPTNGKMRCTRRNRLDSFCTFSCNEGYELTDMSLTNEGNVACIETEDEVKWNGRSPTCTRIMCPRLQIPENGNVACVGDGSLGSNCILSCNVGFDLVGSTEPTQATKCNNDRNGDGVGVWSVESINCAPVRCQPDRTAPQNGAVHCTNSNHTGSVCTFICDDGYDMDDTASKVMINICEEDNAGDGLGRWSAEAASCSTRYHCGLTQTDPEHGTVTCDNESFLGSVCHFECEEGYDLKGINSITCRDIENDGDAEVDWSSAAPVCVSGMCPEQWYDRTSTNVMCDGEKEGNGYPVGTRCTYECKDIGYYLKHSASGEGNGDAITCIAKNTWSRPAAPRCFIKTCPNLEQVENGNQPECTNSNRFGSQCRYKCNDKYSPSHNDPLLCDTAERDTKEGFWDKEPPTCVLNECISIPPNPSKGAVVCSSGPRLGSYCTLECDHGYAPKIARVDCQMTTERIKGKEVEVPKFLHKSDFCCAQCRSDLNLVLAVDVRFSRVLQKVANFVEILLSQLESQDNDVYFSAFTYNAEPHRSSVIERVLIKDADTLKEISEQMNGWEIKEEGRGSDTPAALDFASNTMFASLDSDAANFLIVAVDDSPDNVNSATLSQITERGIHMIVAAGNNFAKIAWSRLLNGGDSVVNQDSSEITTRMFDLAFKEGCSNMAPGCV